MSEKNHSGHLTSGRLLAKNTVWNLIGSSAPIFVAVFSIPILIRGLGKERFGVLTLACELIGYATLFDLGLGRALTQIVAKKLGQGEQRDVPSLAWTSLVLMTVLGFLGAAALVLLSPWLVHRALHMPVGLQGETLQCFYLLGISLPVVIVTSGLRGLLEAHQRFDLVSSLGVPLGVFSFTGPLLVLPFSRSLVPVVGILIIGRLLGCVAHLLLCLKVVPELGVRIRWHPANAVALLRFGGWMMVTNVVGPLMVTLDRFLIGAMLSMAAVAYYATPYEVVTKLWIIPDALLGVMFPAFSTSFAQDRSRAALLYVRSIKYVFLILFPIALLIVVLAQNGLRLWLGAEFAQHSVRVLQLLAVGVFINSLAQIPFTMLQGGGRPDLTAQLHLIELPFYLAALWLLIRSFGIEGAAIAWTGRVAIDALLLFGMAKRLLPSQKPVRARTALLSAMPLLILAFAPLLQGAIEKSIFLIGTVLCFALAMWFRILTPEERALAQGYR
jgi:O-antigen/teichoic acid export membrane protein